MTAEATGKVLITFTFFLNEIPINCAVLSLRGEGTLSSGPRAGSDFPPHSLPASLPSSSHRLRRGLEVLQHDVIVTASHWWRSKHDPAVRRRHSGGGSLWSPLHEERGVGPCRWAGAADVSGPLPSSRPSSPSCGWLESWRARTAAWVSVSELTERPQGVLMASFEV